MASRRNLKKHLNYISEVTIGMCFIEGMNADAAKREVIAGLVEKAMNLRADIISRISHTEPGNVKGFYKKLRSDFNTQIEEIFNKLNEK